MKRYRIQFTDCGDTEIMRVKAYDFDHAEEVFWDRIEDFQGDHLGIHIISIQRIS